MQLQQVWQNKHRRDKQNDDYSLCGKVEIAYPADALIFIRVD